MSLTLVTPPQLEPVDTSDAQAQAVVAHAGETGLLARLIAAARAHVEQVTWRQLITVEYGWRLER